MTTELLERCRFPHSHPMFLESPSREMVELLLLELVVGKQKLKDIEETWTLDNFRKDSILKGEVSPGIYAALVGGETSLKW